MNERSILIVDSDQKNLKVLDTSFSEASFVTAIANSDNEALSILETDSFYIVLCDLSAPSIDGYKLLKEIQRSPVRDGCHVVFTSTKSDIWNRVKSIKLGAKDFIVKPVHAAEVVARVNMLICRLQRNEENVAVENSQFSGRLEDLAVMDLVEIFGAEKKTGVLTVHNENGHSGQVICYQGQVISANMQSLRSEEAIYKMMHWNRGRFSMSFTDVPFYDEFTISNMGLLLQGAKRMDLRNELLKQLPSLDAIVITTSNFKKITSQKEMNAELHEFLKLFDGERTLGRIIDDSHENEIVTLKRIVKLYKLGFLYVLRNFSKGSPLQFRSEEDEEHPAYVQFDVGEDFDDEFDELEEKTDNQIPGHPEKGAGDFDLDEENSFAVHNYRDDMPAPDHETETNRRDATFEGTSKQLDNIIVVSTNSTDLQIFVENIDSDREKGSDHNKNILFSVLKLRGGGKINVLGILPDEAITESMLYFSEQTLGCVLLIDVQSVNWSYQRYLCKTLYKKLSIPLLIVCKQQAGHDDYSATRVKELLDLEESLPIHFIDEIDENSIRRTLFALLRDRFSERDDEQKTESIKTR